MTKKVGSDPDPAAVNLLNTAVVAPEFSPLAAAGLGLGQTSEKKELTPGQKDGAKIARAQERGVDVAEALAAHARIEGVMKDFTSAADPIEAAKAQIRLLGLEEKRFTDPQVSKALAATRETFGEDLIYEIRRVLLSLGGGVSEAERARYDAVLNKGAAKPVPEGKLLEIFEAASAVIDQYARALNSVPAYRQPAPGGWTRFKDAMGEMGRTERLDASLKNTDQAIQACQKFLDDHPALEGARKEAVELALTTLLSAHDDLVGGRERTKKIELDDTLPAIKCLRQGVYRLLDYLGGPQTASSSE